VSEQATAGHGHRVRLDPMGEVAPPGVWRCLDRAPEPGHWWVQPVDTQARGWAYEQKCPLTVVQGCVQWPSRLMQPPDVAALF
jgi:hypothetical protein